MDLFTVLADIAFCYFLVNCLSFRRSFVLFVGICALGEWFTCVFHVPDNVYRLLFYRYLFLFVFRLCKIKLNVWVCGLALIALFLAIFRDIYFCRFDAISYEPMERISLG